jgi:hypothetical protein
MSFLQDRMNAGEAILQDFRPAIDLELFNVVTAARLERRDIFGRPIIEGHEESQAPKRTVGDIGGGFLVENDDKTRAIPMWSFALPALTKTALPDEDAPVGGGSQTSSTTTVTRSPAGQGTTTTQGRSGGDVEFNPVFDKTWVPDERLFGSAAAFDSSPALPKGAPVIVLRGSDERRQQELVFPAQVPLISVNNAGDPRISSIVYDLNAQDELDRDRKASLHSMCNVVNLGIQCSGQASSGLAWQLGQSGRDGIAGFGLVIERLQGPGSIGQSTPTTTTQARQPLSTTTRGASAYAVAYASQQRSGPLDAIRFNTAHILGRDDRGSPIVPLGLAIEALWRDGTGKDAPLDFSQVPYGPVRRAKFLAPTYIRHDANRDHPFVCGRGPGIWALQTEVPFTTLEDPPLTRNPRTRSTPRDLSGPPPEPELVIPDGERGSDEPPTIDGFDPELWSRVGVEDLPRPFADRATSFVGSLRSSSSLLFRAFATQAGQDRVHGGAISDQALANVARAPDVAALVPIGNTDGTWEGMKTFGVVGGVASRGAGGLAILPPRYASPEGLEQVLTGKFDVTSELAQTPETRATLFLPSNLSQIDFATPTGGRTSESGTKSALSKNGWRIRQTAQHLTLFAIDSAGAESSVLDLDDPASSLPITTKGDLIRGDDAGAPERFGIGTNGQILRVVSGQAAWSNESAGVPTTREINTTAPLTGGGDLSADLTIAFANQAAASILAGPASGGDAAPTFKSLADVLATMLTTDGDIIYRQADTVKRLAAGGLNSVLQTVGFASPFGSRPAWRTLTQMLDGVSATNDDILQRVSGSWAGRTLAQVLGGMLTTRGQIIRRGSSAPEALALGATGTLLRSDGTDADWATMATALGSLLTTRGDIARRGASVAERLALGSSGHVLTSDGTDAVWAAPSAGDGVWVPLSQQSASSSSSIDFASHFTDTYRVYLITYKMLPATNNTTLWGRVALVGTPTTYIASGTPYRHNRASMGTGSIGSTGSNGANQMDMLAAIGNAAGRGLSGEFHIARPRNAEAGMFTVTHLATGILQDNNIQTVFGGGMYSTDGADIASLQLLMSSGNIASGVFTLWGLKGS